jgi:hypothetical protein
LFRWHIGSNNSVISSPKRCKSGLCCRKGTALFDKPCFSHLFLAKVLDYMTTYLGGLVLVECKDFKQGVLPKYKKSAIQQLTKLIGLAKRVDASIVILSTLLPFPSSDYNDLANKIKKLKTKTKVSIHLLSLSGNGIVNLKEPEKLVKNPFLFD